MNFSIIIIVVAGCWIFYATLTSVDLLKGLKAVLSGKPLPPHFEFFPKSMPNIYKQILLRNDLFYRRLSRKEQKTYRSRIMKFLSYKEFVGREGAVITNEIMLLISSAAIKITFGLRQFEFDKFHSIVVYKGEFYSRVSQAYVKGETNAAGVIVFSIEDLKFGNSDPHDSINLGYHEFAHALFIEYLMDPYDSEFKDYYRQWLVYIENNNKLEEVREKKIFREYASMNAMEFFAVALENFFEKPRHFKEELPQLYYFMTKMLNQDLAGAQD